MNNHLFNTTAINFHLTTRGFGSEIIQFINILSYGIVSGIRINLFSSSWNSAKEKGWNDYFKEMPFFKLKNGCSHSFTLIESQLSVSFLRYIYVTYMFKKQGRVKLSKGGGKYLYPAFLFYLNALHNTIVLKNEIDIIGAYGSDFDKDALDRWQFIIGWGNKDRVINVRFLDNDYYCLSDLRVALAQYLFNNLSSEMNRKVDKLLNSNPFFKSDYIGVHVRRGDKLIKEAEFKEVDKFISLIERNSNVIRNVFISTDDYSVIKEFRMKRPDWIIHSFTPESSKGHDQASFNNKTKEDIFSEVSLLITEIVIHKNANTYIGTASSNLTKLISLLRNKKETTISLDEIDIDMYNGLISFYAS